MNNQIQFILEATNTGIWEWNVQAGETVFNDQWAAMLGYELEELQPTNIETWMKFTHPDDLKIAQQQLNKYFNHETPFYEAEFRMKHRNGHWVWVLDRGQVAQWTPDGKPLLMLGTHQDITPRKTTEQKLEKTNRLYAVISQVNQAIVHSKNQQNLFEEICRIAIDFGKFRLAWIGVNDAETLKVERVAYAGHENGYLNTFYQITLNKDKGGSGPVGSALRENKFFVCNDIANDPAMSLWRAEALKRDYRSVIALPLKLKHEPIAALAIYSDQVNFFNAEEIKLLEEVAFDISYALDALESEAARNKAEHMANERLKELNAFYKLSELTEDQNLSVDELYSQFANILPQSLQHNHLAYSKLTINKQVYTSDNYTQSSQWKIESPIVIGEVEVGNVELGYLEQTPAEYERPFLKEERMLIDGIAERLARITERIQSRAEIIKSENRFRNLVNQMQLGLAVHEIILDKKGDPVDYRFIDANPSFEHLTGLKRKDIIGKRVLEILPGTEKIWIEKYGKVALTGESIIFENYAQELDRHFSVVAYQPQAMQFAVITEDITEKKNNLLQLEANNTKFRLLSQAATDMLSLEKLDDVYSYITQSLQEQYPETIILFLLVDEEKNMSKLIDIRGVDNKLINKAIQLSGFNIIGKEFKLLPYLFDLFKSGNFHKLDKGLAHFAWPEFPRVAAGILEKMLKINQIYTIGINKDSKLHAIIHFFNRGNTPITDNEYIESFVRQAGIIIDRAKTAELLAESEIKFRLITENASDVIWVLNVSTRKFIYISPAVMQLRGFTAQEAVAQTMEEAVTPDSLILIQKALEYNLVKFLNNTLDSEYYIDEIQQPCKDGRIIWVEVSTKFRFNHLDEIEVVGVSRNIDERKKLEAAILENEQKFHLLFENSPLGIYIANTEGEIEDANPALLTILGSPSLEITKKINVLSLPALIENGYAVQFKKCIEQKRTINIELPYTTHWGKKVFLSSYLVPLANKQGDVKKVYTLMEDITLRKRNEEELIKLSLVAKQNPASIIITNLEGNVEFVNPKFSEVTGYSAAEIMGKNPRILQSGDMPTDRYAQLWKLITNGQGWNGEFHNRKKNGELFWEKASILPIKNADGHIISYLAIKEDITEQRKAQQALIDSEARLKEAVETKDKFFSIISHDLRSPISSILNLSGVMSDPSYDVSPDEIQKYAASLYQTADSTYRLLENLLEWSRLQRGIIPFKPEQFNMGDFMNSCDHSLLEKAKAKRINLDMKYPEELKAVADHNMLRSIMRNLISNAIKFTKHDGKIPQPSESFQEINFI